MNTQLILHLDEHWPAQPAAHWALLDAQGRLLRAGVSEPRHWPAAASTSVVLGGAQCVWLEVQLPRGSRRDEERLIAYALEERLVGDADAQHFTVSHRERSAEGGQRLGVLVIARTRLRSVLSQLQGLGRKPQRIAALAEIAPGNAERWALLIGPGAARALKSGPCAYLALDPGCEAAVIEHSLARARAANAVPQALVCHHAGEATSLQAAGIALPTEPTVGAGAGPAGSDFPPLQTEPDWPWWQVSAHASHPSNPANLLHGEFAAHRQGGGLLQRLRWPLGLGAAALAVLLLANLASVVSHHQQLDTLAARQLRLFETTLPNTPAIAPAIQLQRALDDARRGRGELVPGDLLQLFHAYVEARGSDTPHSVLGLDYAGQRLDLLLPSLPPEAFAALQRRLAPHGVAAERAPRAEGGVLLSLSVASPTQIAAQLAVVAHPASTASTTSSAALSSTSPASGGPK